jgi:hypothetical protein
VPEPADQKVPDLLRRDFTADAANQRYVGDITYLPLAQIRRRRHQDAAAAAVVLNRLGGQ